MLKSICNIALFLKIFFEIFFLMKNYKYKVYKNRAHPYRTRCVDIFVESFVFEKVISISLVKFRSNRYLIFDLCNND